MNLKGLVILRNISLRNRLPTNIIMTWTMVFLGMVLYAVAWFTLGTVCMAIIDAISNSFSFAAPWDSVVEFCRQMVLLHPIFAMVGWLIWGFIDSMRKPVKSWEV